MSEQTEFRPDGAWYVWEEEEQEQGWLLTYVDVLCVILAMLLVLLVTQLQQQSPESAIEASAPAQPIAAAAGPEPLHRVPLHQPLPASLPPPVPVPLFTAGEPAWTGEPPVSAREAAPSPPVPAQTAEESMIAEGVGLVHHSGGVTVRIPDVVLFDSSEAELKDDAVAVLEKALVLIAEFNPTGLAVQGHTDNRPLRGGAYRTNWELAAARANAVADVLLAQAFPAELLRVESYADTRPVADNATDSGRARNRRVELLVEFEGSR